MIDVAFAAWEVVEDHAVLALQAVEFLRACQFAGKARLHLYALFPQPPEIADVPGDEGECKQRYDAYSQAELYG